MEKKTVAFLVVIVGLIGASLFFTAYTGRVTYKNAQQHPTLCNCMYDLTISHPYDCDGDGDPLETGVDTWVTCSYKCDKTVQCTQVPVNKNTYLKGVFQYQGCSQPKCP